MHQRLRVKPGALAFHRKTYGEIIDIGPDGMSFRFQARCRLQPVPETDALQPLRESLDLVSVDDNFILIDLPVAAAADYYFADPHRPTVMLCRRCIQFGDLSPQQAAALEKFLRINRLSQPSRGLRPEEAEDVAADGLDGRQDPFYTCDFNRE